MSGIQGNCPIAARAHQKDGNFIVRSPKSPRCSKKASNSDFTQYEFLS